MTATLHRTAATLETEKGVDSLCFASEETGVLRLKDPKYGNFYEHLSCRSEDADLSVLNAGGPLEWNHDDGKLAGEFVPGTVRCDSDRKCRGDVKWYPESLAIRGEILDGKRPNSFSVGYDWAGEVRRETRADGLHIWFSWKAFEASCLLNTPPADKKAGLYRSLTNSMTLDQILAAALSGSRKPITDDFSDVPLAQVVSELGTQASGRVREMHQAMNCRGGGRGVHFSALAAALAPFRKTRDSLAGDFSSGGAFVGIEMGDFTPLVFNRNVLVASGAEIVDGLTSNFAVPEITGIAPTAQALGEKDKVALSQILTAQDALKPCRVSAQVKISTLLLHQGGQRANAAIARTITDALSTEMDRLGILGQGVQDEPLGLANQPGISSILFGGPASLAALTQAETLLANANLDFGHKVSWVTSPLSRARWKQIPKIAATNYPQFLIGDNGKAGEYGVLASNQLAGQNQAMFAAWDTVKILIWDDGISLLYDPYTQAGNGETVITAICWFNILPTYRPAIVLSADAGNQ